jgi:solute carrier family 25 (mitochondrial S-adenosylmethionine transporter), member 26
LAGPPTPCPPSLHANADLSHQAGAIAAFTVDLLVYPLDTLKTRLQSPDYRRLYINASSNSVKTGALFRGLYQGVGSVILATLPSSGAFFTTYEGVKHSLGECNRSGLASGWLPQPIIHSAASATAELVSCAVLTPAEVIKQNAQMVQGTSGTQVNATVQTLRKFRSNPLGLWRGYTALAGRNLPFTALQFPMFERLKESIKKYRDRNGTRPSTLLESGLITAVSAGTAGSLAAVATTPVDVVKTRIMLAAAEGAAKDATPSRSVVENIKAGGDGVVDVMGQAVNGGKRKASPFKRKSSLQIGREIVAEHGVKGLWRGGALRGMWTMLGSGLYLGVYESGRIYLGQRRGETLKEEDLF